MEHKMENKDQSEFKTQLRDSILLFTLCLVQLNSTYLLPVNYLFTLFWMKFLED